MQYITALIAALVATTSALPAPAALPEGFEPVSANSLEKRTPGGIQICTGPNFTGQCEYKVVKFDTCNILTAPYYHNIGSFRPDKGALCRLTTSEETCTPHGDAFIAFPGTPNLRNYEGLNIGDHITSYKCVECTNCT